MPFIPGLKSPGVSGISAKADKDINTPNTAVKAKAAISWCDQASTIIPPSEYNQPQTWEYLLLSEGLFKNNQGLGFEAFVPLCRGVRNEIIAREQGTLF
jgi:hypothetical protein